LVLGSPEVAASAPQVAAIKSEFLKVCPKCVVKYSGITIANWATQTTPIVNAAILKDSKLSYVMPIYDSQSQLIISAIKTAGAQKRIHITSYDGTPFVLKYLEDGTTVTMDVGQNLSWLAYAFMDQDMRVLAKQAPVANENLPLRAFTSKNVRLTGTPPVNNLGYGNAYISNYYKLWNG
jgi:ribose transport system substrate-binding protein